MQQRTVHKLIRACQRGDRAAQRQLYEANYSWGLNLCLRYARDREEAREMLNDGFLKVFTRLDRWQQHKPFRPWLKTVLVHTAIDHYRRRGLHWETDELSAVADSGTQHDSLDRLQYEDLLQAVQALPPTYRLVFNLYVMEGATHADIAQQLDISENTSRSNLQRARKKLQAMLVDYDRGIIKLTP